MDDLTTTVDRTGTDRPDPVERLDEATSALAVL